MDSDLDLDTYDADVIVALIAAGADIDTHHVRYYILGWDFEGYTKVLKQLLAAGMKFSDEELAKMFEYAIELGKIDQAEVLINAGVNLNIFLENGRTPFSAAIEHKKREIAVLLLKAGADPYLKSDNPEHLFRIACEDGDINTVRYMSPEFNINCLYYDRTPLMIASSRGYIDIIKVLLNTGAYLEFRNSLGYTAIMYAKNNEVAEFLDKEGACINILQLVKVLFDGDLELAQFFIDKGLKPDKKHLNTLLLRAIETEKIELTKFLLNNGADPEDKDSLTYALEYSEPEYVRLLIEAGANPHITNSDGVTALDIALSANKDNASLLQKVFGDKHDSFESLEVLDDLGDY